jgi:hypothetical protein
MIARDIIEPEVMRVSKELQANLAVFLAEMTKSSMVQTIKREMFSQVIDFAGTLFSLCYFHSYFYINQTF